MNKTWLIARREFSTTIRRWSYILLTISFPVIALLGILVYQAVAHWTAGVPPDELYIGYVDETGIFDEYTSGPGVTFIPFPTQGDATQALLEGDISQYFVIPQNYLETGLIARYTTQREFVPPQGVMDLIRGFLVSNLLSGEVSEQVMERAKTPMITLSLRLNEQGEVVPPQSEFAAFALPNLFGILFMLSLIYTSTYLIEGVGVEKENRLIEILLSTVSTRQLLSGKIIGLGAAGLLQIVVWLVSAIAIVGIFSNIPFLAGLTIPPKLIIFGVVYFTLGYLLFATLMVAIGSIGATAREGIQWATIVILPAAIPIMLSSLTLTSPNHIAVTLLTIFPMTAPIMAVMRLAMGEMPTWVLIVSIAVLIASILVAVWLAARVFRTFLLMYGKRPSLREMWRYVREG